MDTSKDLVGYIKKIYDCGRNASDKDHYAKRIITAVPELGGKCVLAMEWKQLEKSVLESATGKLYSTGETFLSDLTMMQPDYDMFTQSPKVSLQCYTCFVDDSCNTQLRSLSSFLQSPPNKSEVRILCIIGHGLSTEQAKTLNNNPPEFDNEECKDKEKMETHSWMWALTFCDNEEGLGEGYTARSVCENAEKGDIVVFESGFLTPEWIVEQLRKRELNLTNGKIPFTLVLLVDSCYSGVWTERIKKVLSIRGFQNTRLVVQTSCAADEES